MILTYYSLFQLTLYWEETVMMLNSLCTSQKIADPHCWFTLYHILVQTPGPNQIAEMRRITVKKALSQGFGWISFCQFLQWMTSQRIQTHRGLFRKIRHLTHGFPQPSWRKQGTERIIWERSIEKPLT